VSNSGNFQEYIWECRKTKIELEHEVLMREMDVALLGLGGLPIAIAGILFQYNLWQYPTPMLLLMLLASIGLTVLENLRENKKEAVVSKERELDALISEISKKHKRT
jgi:hypothetical protein